MSGDRDTGSGLLDNLKTRMERLTAGLLDSKAKISFVEPPPNMVAGSFYSNRRLRRMGQSHAKPRYELSRQDRMRLRQQVYREEQKKLARETRRVHQA